MKYLIGAAFLIATFAALFHYCSPSGTNKTGHEYMPDMVHPVTYEANTYSAYWANTWDKASVFTRRELSTPRGKVEGTIPRGWTSGYYGNDAESLVRGKNASNAISAPMNGEAPFYYKNDATEAGKGERERCMADIKSNPLPISKKGLERGKVLYETYCGICHGNAGNGVGYLVSEENENAKYPAQPANLIKDEFIGASEGRYYYAMMFGKNVMGGYSDKLSWEERWQVMHYIRSLQAKATNSEYNSDINTLSLVIAEKAAKWAAEQRAAAVAAPK